MHTAEKQKPWSQYESCKTLTNPNEVRWKPEVALSHSLKGYSFLSVLFCPFSFKEKFPLKNFKGKKKRRPVTLLSADFDPEQKK